RQFYRLLSVSLYQIQSQGFDRPEAVESTDVCHAMDLKPLTATIKDLDNTTLYYPNFKYPTAQQCIQNSLYTHTHIHVSKRYTVNCTPQLQHF
ncbi:hypothetical protein Ahia01_001312400, partial [Argonauta hians]